MKTFIFWAFLLAFSCPLAAQQDGLEPSLRQLKERLQQVETKDHSVQQELSWDELAPYKMVLTTTKTGKKGDALEERYEFNLADFDPRTVSVRTERDEKQVQLKVDGGQSFVKYFKNGKHEGFENGCRLLALDDDNARELQEAMRAAILQAVKAYENTGGCPMATFDEASMCLATLIGKAAVGETSWEQQWEVQPGAPCLVTYTRTTSKKDEPLRETFTLNLGDLSEQSVRFKVSGDKLVVSAEIARKRKFIACLKNGEQGNYASELELFGDDVDKMRLLQKALRKAIESAKLAQCERPKVSTELVEGLRTLAACMKPLSIGDKSFEPSLEGDRHAVFQLRSVTKDKSTEQEWRFQWGDLNEKSLEIDVSGKAIRLEARTVSDLRFLQMQEGDKPAEFSNKISFPMPDIETAKLALAQLEALIPLCRKEQTCFLPTEQQALAQRLVEAVKPLKDGKSEISQSLAIEQVDERNAKFSLTVVTSDDRKSKEVIYEFNLSGFSAEQSSFDISEKALSLRMESKYKEKTVKVIEDGSPKDYESSFKIRFSDLESARCALEAFRALMK